MAHITVLKESHHSKFQLAAAIDIVALCKNDSISEVKLTRRSSRLSRKLTRWEIFWIGAVYLCELLLLYVTYIYLLYYFYSVDDVEQSEMRERFSCYFERVLIEKMAIFE